jgi:hypothetical protein
MMVMATGDKVLMPLLAKLTCCVGLTLAAAGGWAGSASGCSTAPAAGWSGPRCRPHRGDCPQTLTPHEHGLNAGGSRSHGEL